MGVTVRQKRPDGPFYVFVHHQGRKISQKVGSEKAAERLAERLRAHLVLGVEPRSPDPLELTVGAAAEQWLTEYVRARCDASTYRDYRRLLSTYVVPQIGRKPLDRVTRQDIRAIALAQITKGLSKRSIEYCLAAISAMYNDFIGDGLALSNPCARYRRLISHHRDPKQHVQILTKDECLLLLQGAVELDDLYRQARRRGLHPGYYLFFLCLLRTGLRLGEQLGLQWGDLDFQGGFLEVRRQWKGGRFKSTKGRRLRRVDMSGQLREAFEAARQTREVELAVQGSVLDPEELVFRNSSNRALNEHNVRHRMFPAVTTRVKLRQLHPHLLRHTFASQLLQNGESLVYVRDQLGHSSIKLTVDTYGHLIPGENRGAVDRLDTLQDAPPRAHRAGGLRDVSNGDGVSSGKH